MTQYWCSKCGAAVAQGAEACSRCKTRLTGLREGTRQERTTSSRRYWTNEFHGTVDSVVCRFEEHWHWIRWLLYTPQVLGVYYMWNHCQWWLLGSISSLSWLSGMITYYRNAPGYTVGYVSWKWLWSGSLIGIWLYCCMHLGSWSPTGCLLAQCGLWVCSDQNTPPARARRPTYSSASAMSLKSLRAGTLSPTRPTLLRLTPP